MDASTGTSPLSQGWPGYKGGPFILSALPPTMCVAAPVLGQSPTDAMWSL